MKLIIVLAVILISFFSFGQAAVKPLSIGDKVPPITITNVYNYPSKSIQLSALKGKLVILDFWSTWCGSCFTVMPKMQRLQNEFGDSLQVLLVNTFPGDSIKRVLPLLATRLKDKPLDLPYSLLQTSLTGYFPYKFVPHYVWISKVGRVAAITSAEEVTEKNIRALLQGNNIALHTKRDREDFDYHQPLFVRNNGGNGENFLYRSILTPYIEGVGTTIGQDITDDGKIKRFFALNQSLASLLSIAFSKEMTLPLNRRVYEGDSATTFKARLENQHPYTGYCYETIVPASSHEQLIRYICTDMVLFFGIVPHTEVRKLPCLLLKRNHNAIAYTKYTSPEVEYTNDDGNKYIRDKPISFVAGILNYFMPLPLIDETGEQQPIDINLPDNLYDEAAVLRSLEDAGFTTVPAEREMEVTVITNNSLPTSN
jgi:thiol-disulfide isomerase/thioredoxin